MFTSKSTQTPTPEIDQQPRRETLANLIAAASAALDRDREQAKAYMARAAALLEKESRPRPLGPKPPRGGLAPWQARRIREYVASNIGTRIRTTDLANLAQLSASHFTRAFKETFDETPIGYVSRQRMLYAQQLMLKSSERLSQIALTCGLCDQSHFTRVFRREVGMSPRAWRRQFATNAGYDSRARGTQSTLPTP